MNTFIRTVLLAVVLGLTTGAWADDDPPRQNDAFGDILRMGMGAASAKQAEKDREKEREKLEKAEKEEKKRRKQAKESEDRLLAAAEEIDLGNAMAERMFDMAGGRVANEDLQRYVNLVGRSVALQSPRGDAMYGFVVTEYNPPCTFALPGGWILVSTGMLKNLEDESELAAVLAREISHVASRDLERAMQSDPALGQLTPSATGDARTDVLIRLGDSGARMLLERGLSNSAEIASDEAAVRLLAATGYDPTALSRVLDRAYARKLDGTIRRGSGHRERDQRIKSVLNGDAAGLTGATNRERFRAATASLRAASN